MLWSYLSLIFSVDCSFGVLIQVWNTTSPNAERLWTEGTSGRVYTIFVFTNSCILLTPICTELRFSFTHFYQLYSERYGVTGLIKAKRKGLKLMLKYYRGKLTDTNKL